MFRKIIFLLALVLFVSTNAQAALFDDKVSSGTVEFSSTPLVVTFNSVANHVLIINESTASTVWVTLSGLGFGVSRGTSYTLPNTQTSTSGNAIKLVPSSSISLDYNTDMIGFISEDASTQAGNSVVFVATMDK